MTTWYERNEKTESSGDRREFTAAIFNAYRPESRGSAWMPIVALGAGYALGAILSKGTRGK